MGISDTLNRRVQARPADDEAFDSEGSDVSERGIQREGAEDDDSDDQSQDNEDASGSDAEGSQEDDLDDEELSDDQEDADKDDFQSSLSGISFGALAKAQASMGSKKRKDKSKETNETTSTASPLDDIRARIREAREQKREAASKGLGAKEKREKQELKDKRASKHAPMVQSSKRAVTRKRIVVEPEATAKARDPRFDAAVMGHSGVGRFSEGTSKAYAFLDEYRVSELKDLKAQFARTKNMQQKEELKKQIRSATDKLKAMESKKRERDVAAEHKKREKQLIREGKKSNPYFLKNSDLKKQVLEKKYEGMKSKDRAKALERRRKKMASKERKDMPMERRGMGDDEPPSYPSYGGNMKRRRLA
ncbi:rRNA biogenesis protein rrp36 [Penicillium angulare]|uniref:rRNA biogenesis protein rrp36 n=1 Tax=Penicillium angulare TaxID=116970 RepID=UPI0025410B2B|nr:rRNA biogenesis protein rrp36 [Penicillium angulare]KAJ5280002.1 rRNA biogenesis protein rrp36 [Penicillium angulare]